MKKRLEDILKIINILIIIIVSIMVLHFAYINDGRSMFAMLMTLFCATIIYVFIATVGIYEILHELRKLTEGEKGNET
jgi:membrane protein YdbS with pleckstrin-like domain